MAACGGSNQTSGSQAPPSTTTIIERPDGLVDELVAIDSGRMHIRCVGSGDTTVLLIAGWGDGGESWAALSPASTVVSVQDTGHTIQLDQPALVIEEVARLLEGTP